MGVTEIVKPDAWDARLPSQAAKTVTDVVGDKGGSVRIEDELLVASRFRLLSMPLYYFDRAWIQRDDSLASRGLGR